jgi:hypothetical protein
VRLSATKSGLRKLRFVTEGVLTRRLPSDPSLQGVDNTALGGRIDCIQQPHKILV